MYTKSKRNKLDISITFTFDFCQLLQLLVSTFAVFAFEFFMEWNNFPWNNTNAAAKSNHVEKY